jgi:hypothetical protein
LDTNALPQSVARSLKTQTIHLAARMAGSPRKLRDLLGSSSADIASWLAGNEQPPDDVFLQCLELILDELDTR